ncbi:globin domain-containing protein [Streptomyces sp. AK08-02]|uniref:globin domain-containing protein n=1 Tax=Streptomyces sp. AK08-02 TaxID=3028654 RepID=UPI0029B2BAF6|nr:globin domain-containing protein [Streptomyces sp. AK08-02]MDX3747221.1 globin domain-containing protein [Streptomyces sp. AK08-02]
MDAPTTTSADNGTSGGSAGGGWFKPHTQPEAPPGGEQDALEGSRLAALRPVGRPSAGAGRSMSSDHNARPAEAEFPPEQERIPGPPTPQRPTTPPAPAPLPPLPLAPASPLPAPFTPAPSGGGAPVLPPFAPEPKVSGTSADAPDSAHPAAPLRPVPALGYTPSESSRTPPAPSSDPYAPVQGPAVSAEPREQASPDAVLIRRTMDVVGPVADKATSYFYALLFVRHPELRSLFPAAMDTQRDRLLKALLTAAKHIDNTEILVAYLKNLGRGHRKYGTRPEHYPAVGECLIGSLSRYAAAIWDQETEAAWVRAYTTMSQVMIDAAAVDELRAPAWWYGEVVSHDLRTPEIAVITIRPDQPYPFLAGQYTSLETPWWPRIWRHYSFASAPRSDGLLSFHVKAVPAGWVSNALVHRARPGDIVRLGPAAGTMTVDHTTNSGLLCLGGGTGIAPIKALVEDVAEHGDRRRVEVFYGARTDLDLYDIDSMLRLQQIHSWLAVRAVIDQQTHLQLPDAVREYGPWYEHDAYLSGPPGMIRNGVVALRRAGIPVERIHHDAVEELVVTGN